jgi:hypothetical protein
MARRKNVEDAFEDGEDASAALDEPAEDVVSNASDVPLFAGSGFANHRSIAKLKLVKLDNPGAGYKGEIPTTSTLETIGQLFGDGLYNIEAVNQRGVRLRTLENQRIALGFNPHDVGASAGAPKHTNVVGATTDVDRIERLARLSANESVQQATAFRDLVVATTTASAAREREFMAGVLAQQSQSAAQQAQHAAQNAAQQQAFLTQAFSQQMAQQQASHNQMIEALGVLRKSGDSGDSGDAAERLMAIFMQGMQMGRQFDGGGEEQPFWQEIIRGGIGVLGATREKQLAAMNPAELSPGGSPTKAKRPANIGKLAKIAAAMRKRGIDADRLLDMLESGAPRADAAEPNGTDDESEADLEDERSEGPIFTSS